MKILAVLVGIFVALVSKIYCQHIHTKQAAFKTNIKPKYGCQPVSNKELYRAIKNSGILSNPSIELVRLKGALRSALRKNNGTLTVLQAARNRRHPEVCEEEKTFKVVEANDYMAYSISSVKCIGGPFCLTAKISSTGKIGEIMKGRCELRRSSIAITVAADCHGTTTKTVEFGCSCKCLKFP